MATKNRSLAVKFSVCKKLGKSPSLTRKCIVEDASSKKIALTTASVKCWLRASGLNYNPSACLVICLLCRASLEPKLLLPNTEQGGIGNFFDGALGNVEADSLATQAMTLHAYSVHCNVMAFGSPIDARCIQAHGSPERG